MDSSLHKIAGPLRTGLILLEGSHKISGRARTGLIRSLGRQPPPLPTHLAPTAGSRHKISQPNSHRPHSLSWKGATNPICIDHSLSWKATTTRTSRLNSHRPHSPSFGGSHYKISRPCSHPPARLERSHHKSQPVDRVFNSTTETSKKHMLASLRARLFPQIFVLSKRQPTPHTWEFLRIPPPNSQPTNARIWDSHIRSVSSHSSTQHVRTLQFFTFLFKSSRSSHVRT